MHRFAQRGGLRRLPGRSGSVCQFGADHVLFARSIGCVDCKPIEDPVTLLITTQ